MIYSVLKNSLSVAIISLLLLTACAKKKVGLDDYLKYLNKTENGLVKTKKVNGYILTLKYLSPEYLTARELTDYKKVPEKSIVDSLLKVHRTYQSFLLTFSPDEEKGNHNDIMLVRTSNYSEFSQKVEQMNFFMGDKIQLKTQKGDYAPVLTNLENTYGLSKARSLTIVFAPEKNANEFKDIKNWEIVYDDELFGAGILHFNIDQKDIDNLPELTL